MKRKYWLTLFVGILMAVSILAGCTNSSGGDAGQEGKAEAPATSETPKDTPAAEDPAPDLSPISYTINTADNKLIWDTPITKAITEKTGVTLEYDITVGDQFQKWDLWLAAGDYPDIVVLDTNYITKYKEAGAIIPLNDLIDQYGPNIKEKFGQYYNLLKDENGEIYGLYAAKKSTEASADSMANFVVQMAVLEEAGYPEIKTLDQLYEVIKAYYEKHPTIDGKETVAFGAAAGSYFMNIQFNNPIIWASGLPDHGNFRIEEDGQVRYNPVTEDAKRYYQFQNKLFTEGLFDKEAFSLADLSNKMSQGRMLAAFAPNWMIGDAEKTLRAARMPERAYAHIPLFFEEGTPDFTNNTTPTFAGSYNWAISKHAKNPERIIQFIDYLFSDEAQVLTNWGIEGVHYDVVDGKRTLKPEVIEKRATDVDYDYKEGFKSIGTGGPPWFSVGNGSLLADGDYATPLTRDVVKAGYDDYTKNFLAKYGKEVWADFLPPIEVVPGYLWQLPPPEETKVEAQKIDDNWRKLLPKVVMARNNEEFEAAWNEMVKAIQDSGLEKMEAAYTQVWADFIKKYNETLNQ
ncbi:extracellular solute-binding protein [Paenibacillus sp.]|uniref:extracellular solute-binding protein n=1 Tax=Paenibacillus sp. TaxID=58172 RepID=UPI002D3620C3|nr:extracellular solute-binding protein [Paenibacillus sp.]HZG58667.1 extracellular solute-binding protein [Paenibacillus sp.]